MLLSLKWLREFVPYTGGAEELGEKLTMLGLELDELIHPYKELEALVVGHVLECGRHPDADKLSVCKVDVGSEVLDIVCGAPNVARGQYVVVAPVGAALPGGLVIKKAKLRGQPSHGMICSERELGLSDEHSGIMVLEELLPGSTFTPGQAAVEAMNLDTEVLDISITPNRPDCLSVLGLAREAALAWNLPLSLPELDRSGVEATSKALDGLGLEVESGEVAQLYMLQAIEGVKAGKSPAWLRWRLNACGLRSISNIVDVTNYVMLELGQPLHSFDFAKVRGGRVGVALAKEGERLVTLDGQERVLKARDITIRDAEGPIGLGGVMGGANSEIDDASTAVLLESAVFNPSNIRFTSKRLDLPSDAAYRFERGVDQAMTAFALERAALLIARLGGGRMAQKPLSVEPKPLAPPQITLRQGRAEALAGVKFDTSFCHSTLTGLGCKLEPAGQYDGAVWRVTPPSWRGDITREADLIEELARVYGVDRIPETLPRIGRGMDKAGPVQPKHKFFSSVKRWAAGLGLNEAVNYSFVGHKDLDFLGLPQEGRISISNPLSSELDVLRTALAPGLLNTLRNNLAQGEGSLRIFELAAAFHADPESPFGTGVREDATLGIMLYGERFASPWPQQAEDMDYLDLKGFVEHLFAHLHLGAPVFRAAGLPGGAALPWLSPAVEALLDGKALATLGRVRGDLADACHARKDVWLAEIKLDPVYEIWARTQIAFSPLPVYPPVRRDITVIAPLELESGAILAAIAAARPQHMAEAKLVDLYSPKDSKERNLTYRLTFRRPDRTLQDAEVDKERDKVAKSLKDNLPVRI